MSIPGRKLSAWVVLCLVAGCLFGGGGVRVSLYGCDGVHFWQPLAEGESCPLSFWLAQDLFGRLVPIFQAANARRGRFHLRPGIETGWDEPLLLEAAHHQGQEMVWHSTAVTTVAPISVQIVDGDDQESDQASGQALGQASDQASGRGPGQASGQESGQESGRESDQASDQTSGRGPDQDKRQGQSVGDGNGHNTEHNEECDTSNNNDDDSALFSLELEAVSGGGSWKLLGDPYCIWGPTLRYERSQTAIVRYLALGPDNGVCGIDEIKLVNASYLDWSWHGFIPAGGLILRRVEVLIGPRLFNISAWLGEGTAEAPAASLFSPVFLAPGLSASISYSPSNVSANTTTITTSDSHLDPAAELSTADVFPGI